MEDVEKYQQRLQAIEDRRRQLEEEERQKRESEDEWLKLAQEKRKCLREQWLSETPPHPVPTSAAVEGPETPEDTPQEASECQRTPEERAEAADVKEHESTTPPNQHTHPFSCTHNHYQADGVDQDLLRQVIAAAEDPLQTESMYHEGRLDGRSVLGMVAVQVERDPKTGATVVRSVAPVSSSGDMTVPVFDDGRKSVHAVLGAGAGQPSAEELGQILSAVDGVGMRVLLDDVTVTPRPEDMAPPPPPPPGEGSKRGRGEDVEEEEEAGRLDGTVMVVREIAAGTAAAGGDRGDDDEYTGAEYRAEDGPVTLTFMGYADGQEDEEEEGEGGREAALTVERVIIADDGEETVLGPVELRQQSNGGGGGGPKEPSAHEGVFQDVPLNALKEEEEGGEKGKAAASSSSSPGQGEEEEEGRGAPKRKACQCCSVM